MSQRNLDYVEAEVRVKLYAATIGVEPPARLVTDEDTPTQELGEFCRRYGASLDWIFCGDVRGMIHDSYRVAQMKQEE